MRKLLSVLAATVLLSGFGLAFAAETKTLTGDGKCAKCALGETDSCQNVVIVEDGGKETTYYITHNDVSKAFHKNVCKETKKIKVTGEVKDVDGKMEITPTEMTVVE